MHPMKSQDEFETAVHWFCKEVGVLVDLIVDGFSDKKKLFFNRFCDLVDTTLKTLEPSTPWENRGELHIGFLKEAVRKHMRESNSPTFL